MKKFIAAAAALFMLLSTPAYAENIYEPSQEAYELVDYVNGMINEPYKSSACQMFVRKTFEDCLNVKNTCVICCATKAWEVYGVSDSKDIPIGATVYFSGSSVVDSYCGKSAGHVGIYIGDGYIAHDWGSKIIKTTVKYVTDKGYKYLGWGWQGNHPLTVLKAEDKLPEEETEEPQEQAEEEKELDIFISLPIEPEVKVSENGL